MKHSAQTGAKRNSCSIAACSPRHQTTDECDSSLPPAKAAKVGPSLQRTYQAQITQTSAKLRACDVPSSSEQHHSRKKQLLLELLVLTRTVKTFGGNIEQSGSLDDILHSANASLAAGAHAMRLAAELLQTDHSIYSADAAINVAEIALATTLSKIQMAQQLALQVVAEQRHQYIDDELADTGSSSCCMTAAGWQI